MEHEIFDYCKKRYAEVYQETKRKLEKDAIRRSKTKTVSDKKREEIEATSQLRAIKVSMIDGRKIYPNQIPLLWNSIYKAHLYRKSGIKDPVVVEKAIKAEQSWRASSGHAFEEMVTELGTLALTGTSIRYILQKDLSILLKAHELGNQPTDIAWLEKQVSGSIFDVYVVADISVVDENTDEVMKKPFCFGCVQCKTSIRDRVSRDVVPSKEAMESKFWSIGFVLDGSMFNVPKYRNMANGNVDSEFKKNGWHGLYVLSYETNDDRIYGVDLNFDIVREHTIKAFNAWQKDRMGFTIDWRAN